MKLNEIQFAIMVIMARLKRVDKRMIGHLIFELSWNKWLSIHPEILTKEIKQLEYYGLLKAHPRKVNHIKITRLGKLWYRAVIEHDGLLFSHQSGQFDRKHNFAVMHPKRKPVDLLR